MEIVPKSAKLMPVLVLTLGTDRLIPLFYHNGRDGVMQQAWGEDKQVVWHEAFRRLRN